MFQPYGADILVHHTQYHKKFFEQMLKLSQREQEAH